MRLHHLRSALAIVAGVGLLSCNDAITGPAVPVSPVSPAFSHSVTTPQVVISQVYGGGGNSGAPLRNDFIELYNPGNQPVSLAGWSVQYASSTGTSWQVTALSGAIQPGGYYLIQQAGSTSETFPALPTPDATGSIMMALGAGKVWLASQATAFTADACPTTNVVDKVSYGTAASDCGFGRTATLSNTTAAIRNSNGCAYSEHLGTDFSTGAPAPRNSSSPTHTCPTEDQPPASVTVEPDAASVAVGGTQAFTATARDAGNNPVGTTFTWSSDDEDVATVDGSGVVTAIAVGAATITATTPNDVSGSAAVTVTPPSLDDVVISQIYGGGGNSGSTYRNDFVELFNRGDAAVNLSGWTVQYASATGTSWQVTPISGTLQPGHHYLVQQAAGAGGTVDLPTPDATGTINMAAGAGKVSLVNSAGALSGACPTGSAIIDRVSYGTTATDCGAGRAAAPSAAVATLRKNDGCVKTGNLADDFAALAPVPRNTAGSRKHCTQPEREQSTATVVINELMGDPASAESASWGQWFEVHNYGSTPVNLQGWTIVTQGSSQPDHVITSSVPVPAGGFAVLGRGADIARNGGVALDYNYFVGNTSTIWLDDSDYLMLVDGAGARVDSVAWTSLPRGVTKGLRSAAQKDANVDGANWGYSTTTFGDGDYGTPGVANTALANEPPFVSANRITVSGRTGTDAPLPVGFEAQLFATERDPNNQIVETTFTWASLTPAIASVDQRGVIRGLAAGNALFRVTSASGAFRNHGLPIETPVASATADYRKSTEFGVPTDGNPGDDFLVWRREFTTSWNGARGIPNWVAYNLNGTQIQSGQDRCNCFTFDPIVQGGGFAPYTTADYTGVGGSMPFHGFPIDRGHLVRSFDRTTGTLDNARTYYFSNIVPQYADMNQGPWANLENHLGALATVQNKEIYIYAGASGFTGLTVKNEGKIAIPQWNWKVAVIMERGQGLADVRDYRDVEVIAAVLPNIPGIRNENWQTQYVVTVDSVEKLSGYTLLSALPGNIQRALKLGNQPPIAYTDGPYTTREGTPVTMSSAGSIDPNGSIVSYQWLLGDGAVKSGASITHTYALTGSYTVRLIVTDNHGLVDTASTTANVARILPASGLLNLRNIVDDLRTRGVLNAGNANSLLAKVNAAEQQLAHFNTVAFVNQIESLVNETNALQQAGRLPATDAERLRFEAARLVRAVTS